LVGAKNYNEGISILFGDGAGNFLTPTTAPGDASDGIAVGDFNGDGKSDVAALDGNANVSVLHGDGTGQLGAPTLYGVGDWATGIVSADFNADGKPDLAVASRQDAVHLLYGLNGGGFAGTLNFNVGYRPDEIVRADFNRDAYEDLAVINGGTLGTGTFSAQGITILLGDGTGRMGSAPVIPIQSSGTLTALVSADFNNDGKADLAVAAAVHSLDAVEVLLGNGDGTFAAPINIPLNSYGSIAYNLDTADVNHDGFADIVVAFNDSGNFATLLGTGSGHFNVAAGSRVTGSNFFEDFTIADFNQDTHLDLAYVRYHDKFLTILFGNGSGYFNTRRDHALPGNPLTVIAHDFNRDGKADVAFTATSNFNNYYVSARLGDGTGNFGGANDFSVGDYPQAISTGDFNGDNVVDLAVVNSLSASLSVLTGDGAGGFGLSVPFAVGGYPNSSVAGDFNRDGKIDLAVTRQGANSVAILLNDFVAPRPCISVNDVTFTEGDVGAGNASFNVTLSEASAQTVRVNFRIEPRGLFVLSEMNTFLPTPGVDYQPVSGTLTFAPGTTTQTIDVPVNGDLTDEYDEAFSVLLSSPTSNAVIHDTLGIGTILDNDAPPTFIIQDISASEGNTTFNPKLMEFTVTLSAASGKPILLPYQTADGTATAAVNDYQQAISTLNFAPGTSSRIIGITINGDTAYEPDETFFVNLGSPENATLSDAQAQGTIVNDDPQPTISVFPASIGELDSSTGVINVPVQLSNFSSQPVTVNYTTVDGTANAGSDYVATSGSLTINPGDFSQHIRVTVLGDTIDETDETFSLTLSNPVNATLGMQPSATVTIIDNDGPNISINDISISEGDFGLKNATFNITLSGASPQSISVNYSTIFTGGSSTSGHDYRPVSQRVFIAPGQTSVPVNVQIIGDTDTEPDETLTVLLSASFGATIADAFGTCIILNDDNAGSVQFSAPSYSVSEGAAFATFDVERVGGSSGTVSVLFNTDGGTATAGSDYQAVGYTITFLHGETAKKGFLVPIKEDTLVEDAETVNLILRNPSNGALLGNPATALLTIRDNDPSMPEAPTLQFGAASYAVGEEEGRVTVQVTLTGGSVGGVSVDYRTVDTDAFTVSCDDPANNNGGAFARCDFATTVGRLDFAAGETQKTISVPLINDTHDEAAETFQIVLSNASGVAVLGTNSNTTVIVQDDDPLRAANPIFTTSFFVRQHYLDFLSREPEANEPWSAILNNCPDVLNLDAASPSAACDRITVSRSFFGSPEFRLKGFSVFRFYKLVFNRLPEYTEIVSDMSFVAGATAEEVFARKAQLATAFTQRQEFTNAYGGLSNTGYVEALLGRYGLNSVRTNSPQRPDDDALKVILTQADLIGGLNAGTLTRAQVLRAVADSDEVGALEFDNAFVAMQYYGYLRRKPEPAGYEAWLKVLRRGDIRTMVNGFLYSAEYKLRFGRL
ncbi:MAG TPA: Calx-beta domain-containing protein, partial [Pyrinomonadaceae bacterium]